MLVIRPARLVILASVVAASSSATADGRRSSIFVASLKMGRAVILVEEDYRNIAWPVSQRSFLLRGPNGHTVTLKLRAAGGHSGNTSLNLFKAGDERYLLTSERDCVEFDPIQVSARYCSEPPPCRAGRVELAGAHYLGRFDWMNGYDPPRGDFNLRFRFLPREDAVESGGCPAGNSEGR